ncbi:MAG: hypothetical protein AseanaTS_10810 [Candidatus Pelagadaptatus aseana]|uniref:hypothetical protein n=1 Tax=Candidatus Pelagadaptatus aseana TaxID=3120508 RepID=UPI0039B18005
MAQVFLLQNQRKQFLTKQGDWGDGRDAGHLYRTVHHDEALNQMIETNAKDYTLRIKVLECATNDRGVPQIADEDLPPLSLAESEIEEP